MSRLDRAGLIVGGALMVAVAAVRGMWRAVSGQR